MSDSESNKTEKKKVSPEFVENVKRYLAVDDKLRDIREKSKVLNNEKKEKEEFILKYLQTIEEEETLSLEAKEIELIKKSLDRNKGKRKAAADELGISERTLYRKIKQYNLESI
mgnify:CR=1 FL=1